MGAGAAGLNAAVHLLEAGERDVLVVTEGKRTESTSAQAGSDKQTYYKLALQGAAADSPVDVARALLAGGSCHGDLALVEANYSAREFFHLVALGVPFPTDDWGGFPGYKTDHDPRQRATSAGPLTSRLMVERLLDRFDELGGELVEGLHACTLLVAKASAPAAATGGRNERVVGVLAAKPAPQPARGEFPLEFVAITCDCVVWATGGPAGLYHHSAYPPCQVGSTGVALRAGATARNLAECQFGLVSLRPRWNLSGSYQQAIPTYFSTSKDGSDRREFLAEVFPEPADLARAVFLKGYQWPLDSRKVVGGGSSLVDLMVLRERRAGRKVWLDFRANFSGFDLDALAEPARSYLERCGALIGDSPLDRLLAINPEAVAFFSDGGVDLSSELLEVAVCHQHFNGGLAADGWWESESLAGLFPVGEVNGSHGPYRPGGAALNAGQVGGLRAAEAISTPPTPRRSNPCLDERPVLDQVAGELRLFARWWSNPAGPGEETSVREGWRRLRERSEEAAGPLRPVDRLAAAKRDALRQLNKVDRLCAKSAAELLDAARLRDALTTQVATLATIEAHARRGGISRGGSLLLDQSGRRVHPALPETWRVRFDGPDLRGEVAVARWVDDQVGAAVAYEPVRPIPETDEWFEVVWRSHRQRRKASGRGVGQLE